MPSFQIEKLFCDKCNESIGETPLGSHNIRNFETFSLEFEKGKTIINCSNRVVISKLLCNTCLMDFLKEKLEEIECQAV